MERYAYAVTAGYIGVLASYVAGLRGEHTLETWCAIVAGVAFVLALMALLEAQYKQSLFNRNCKVVWNRDFNGRRC